MMKTIHLSKERRYLLLGGAIVLLLAAIYRFYPAISALLPDQNQIAIMSRQAVKYQRKISERDVLQEQIVALSKNIEHYRGALLEGTTPSLAAVNIQNLLNEIVAANHLQIDSVQMMKVTDSAVAGFQAVPVQVNLTLSIRQLLDLLYKIESAKTLLDVTDLNIKGGADKSTGKFQVRLTVAGYQNKEQKTER